MPAAPLGAIPRSSAGGTMNAVAPEIELTPMADATPYGYRVSSSPEVAPTPVAWVSKPSCIALSHRLRVYIYGSNF
ncbi:hypothetical protein [Mastigocladopsis repens]|uniref:hypothetical protein n=1 Tax=Mastigocladopsis repens TaxID=221287 RepID=UPI0012EA1109|nr:hypothetical protein [Mastigocladopsis repens]